MAAILVAATAVILFLTRSADESASGEVFLQAAAEPGRDPYTTSTAEDSSAPASPTATPSAPAGTGDGTPSVRGSSPGLYGGTRNVASCDVEKQIAYLTRDRAKGSAFAGVVGIERSRIPSYLRSLTPVQLRMDTRVTNHGYKDGKATSYQSVLQAGTAVLAGPHGVPRVRCACGNPLQPPVPVTGNPQQVGRAWPGYRSSEVVVVDPAPRVIDVFVLYDPETGTWIERRRGDEEARNDRTTTRPENIPSESPSSPSPDSSPTTRSPGTSTPSEPPDTPTSESPQAPTPEQPTPESPAPDGSPP
ncbi:DUF6777 domain-containing protein [Streptomyces sp. 8N706]|uniref:DUF6777 domain-containing protein n=1 Tax=Streptomyces sp. 8N706 TaxID=3457416 RepID=UPI003FD4E7A2